MKIYNITTTNQQTAFKRKNNGKQITFGFYSYVENHRTIDTHYLRDFNTLSRFADRINETFPNGAVILKYACSTGEGTTSLAALLDNEKINIIGLDISEQARKVRFNQHHITDNAGLDERYLVDTYDNIPPEIKDKVMKVRDFFKKHFYYEKSDYEPYRRMKAIYGITQNKIIPNLIYPDNKYGNILDLNDLDISELTKSNKPIAGISFRNAIFQLGAKNHGIGKNVVQLFNAFENNPKVIEKKEIADNIPTLKEYNEMISTYDKIVKSMNKKLEMNGLAMIGNSPNDHYFITPQNIKNETTMSFAQTEYSKSAKKANLSKIFEKVNIFKDSPLKELFLNNGFVEEFDSNMIIDGRIVTTIFKKIKDLK